MRGRVKSSIRERVLLGFDRVLRRNPRHGEVKVVSRRMQTTGEKFMSITQQESEQ